MELKRQENKKIILGVILVVIFSFTMITNESMWGDETCRVFGPAFQSVGEFMKTAIGYAQPGYYILMAVWCKLFGASEYAVRCINIPFSIMLFYYVIKILDKKQKSYLYSILFFIHPMYVYYINEATPYIMLYSLSIVFIWYVFFQDNLFDSKANIIKINSIFLVGVLIHFIFGFIYILYIAKCLYNLYMIKNINIRNHIQIFLYFMCIYVPVLVIYLVGLGKGVTTGFGIKSLLYIIYSFLGYSGLALSRNDLRAGNFTNLTNIQLIVLIIFTISYVCVFTYTLLKHKDVIKNNIQFIISAVGYIVIFSVCAFIKNFGLWERHVIAIFPLYMLIFIDIISEIMNDIKKSYKLYLKPKLLSFNIFVVLVILIISSYNIRFNYYYTCDDYKGVLAYVIDNSEKIRDSLVFANCDNEYYSITKASEDYKFKFVKMEKNKDYKELINDKAENNNYIIVLFEKNCSKDTYKSFDNDDNYAVINDYNSFKIIKPVN